MYVEGGGRARGREGEGPLEFSAQVQLVQVNVNNSGKISGEWGFGKAKGCGQSGGLALLRTDMFGWVGKQQASRCQPGASLLCGELGKGCNTGQAGINR